MVRAVARRGAVTGRCLTAPVMPSRALRPAALLGTALLLGVTLAGCGGSDDRTDEPTGGATTAPAVPASPAPPSQVRLGADGLILVDPAGATTGRLDFSTAGVGTVRDALGRALGAGRDNPLPACPQGPRTSVQYDGFSVLLDGTRFVGWTERGSAERNLTTTGGLGLQSSLADVRAALPDAVVRNGPRGPEFTAGGSGPTASPGVTPGAMATPGLSGLLDGTTPMSRVTSMSGGETCSAA